MKPEEWERMSETEDLKRRLKEATRDDFQIVDVGEPYPYAVSWAGCTDIALFKRKADAERFIKTFGSPRKHNPNRTTPSGEK